MNILITSAGRRNELLRFFKAHRDVSKIVVCDMNPHAAAFEDCDKGFLAPPLTDSRYETFLLEICKREEIDLVFTLNDFELPLLSRMKDQLAGIGTLALVSDPEIIDICWDKSRTNKFLADAGFLVPVSFSFDEIDGNFASFPVIIKPRFGTASIAVEVANTVGEFEVLYKYSKLCLSRAFIGSTPGGGDLLIQERILGTEYAVDIINNLGGEYQGCVVKKKLGIRGGDADCVVSLFHEKIEDWCRDFSAELKHVGNVDCDLICRGGDIYCVDINPRFGGAYPFSHLSGIDLPGMIVSWVQGIPAPQVFSYSAGVVTARTEKYMVLSKGPQAPGPTGWSP